ncbi:F-box protein At1g67340-like [Phoenix dactylifera]|uniref:F-box protein At1g67340 n=1 Tax=Phoenix dactylifera TaxID=42345 RepID=A0A8B7C376_PHODC|nr:F-box protein At1g67340 [Phoenix dactylifera]XP_038984347.1 F-box protein At1g67340-like [Phoenix dactylifera]
METRSGSRYPKLQSEVNGGEGDRKRRRGQVKEYLSGKRRREASPAEEGSGDEEPNFLNQLPDDIVVCILCKLSSSAACPSDLINVLLICKRLNGLGLHPLVLSRAAAKSLAVRAKNWSESAHRFLKQCADAGNLEACFILGMIRFYCLQNRGSGAALMARAAMGSHAAALYSLAVIQFNGSGGSKNGRDLRAGVALCARAAFLGHVDALRELGHCLQDGYGVRRNVAEGRRFLVQANARELAAVLSSSSWPPAAVPTGCCPLLSDFGWSVPATEPHPANRFLVEWFGARGGVAGDELRLCSHGGCGRPETRRHEFRRCSVCGTVNYCSRACQALDWKLAHKVDCAPMEQWLLDGAAAPAAAVGGGDAAME